MPDQTTTEAPVQTPSPVAASPAKKSNNTIWWVLGILGCLFVCCIVGSVIAYFAYDYFQKQEVTSDDSTADETWDIADDTVDTSGDETLLPDDTDGETGTIEGSVGYPGEGIPENMKVCAENIDTADEYCATGLLNGSQYTYGKGYKIEVPVGSYYVYAQVPGDSYQAYYTEFVTCGQDVSCPSHDPILVEIESSGDTVSSIDPQDWYD
jgi:hypothetical protein